MGREEGYEAMEAEADRLKAGKPPMQKCAKTRRCFSSDRELMRSDDLPDSHLLRQKRRHRRRSPMHHTLVSSPYA